MNNIILNVNKHKYISLTQSARGYEIQCKTFVNSPELGYDLLQEEVVLDEAELLTGINYCKSKRKGFIEQFTKREEKIAYVGIIIGLIVGAIITIIVTL